MTQPGPPIRDLLQQALAIADDQRRHLVAAWIAMALDSLPPATPSVTGSH